jgi:cytochrome P450
MSSASSFPIGASVTLEQLEDDPHPVLARLREREPVSWIPALRGWLVTRYDLALAVMRDSGSFTVDDPRFSTAQVIGPSMLSLDGEHHTRNREPFVAAFRPAPVRERFAEAVEVEAERLLAGMASAGAAELRRSFAGPLSASIVTNALGLERSEAPQVLGWYDAIVSAVTAITAGERFPPAGEEAFRGLRSRLAAAIDDGNPGSLLATASATARLSREQIISNAAVLLFGGIETTEGMLANAVLHLLARPQQLAEVRRDPRLLSVAIEESLRLEPAAGVVDRYATADVSLAEARIRRGDLVRVSISAANRDPTVFPTPDELDLTGANGRRHLAFAHGPHVCLGIHLARLEARTAIDTLLRRLPSLRLDPERPSRVSGLVFRKPSTLNVVWG